MDSASFRREAGEAAAVVGLVVLFGLACAALARPAATPPPAFYPLRVVDDELPALEVWLVDGFNVLHAGVLGGRDRSSWWTRERREELLARAACFDDPDAELWVVFDGPREPEESAPGRARPVFAPSADEWLVARVRESGEPARIAVVTADRRLAGRARQRGARVVSPGDFLARCRAPLPG